MWQASIQSTRSHTERMFSVLCAVVVALSIAACAPAIRPPPCLVGLEKDLRTTPATVKWDPNDFRPIGFSVPEIRKIQRYPLGPCEPVNSTYRPITEFIEVGPGELSISYDYQTQGWSPMVAVRRTFDWIMFSTEAGHTYLITVSTCNVDVTDEATGTRIARKTLDLWHCP
jgi:hypothetical protein